jgi:pantoate--beta-alanine ligase
MQEISDPSVLRDYVRHARCAGKRIGLVPTMGYLHAGHARLMDEARLESDLVIASIFVNPAQFGPSEDFDRYPRDLGHDRELARAHHVDVLFVPAKETIYPGGVDAQQMWVDPGEIARFLEGRARPGHFRGVTTMVTKLFNLASPDRAFFGQKDAQQALIIGRLVRDLAFPVEIRIVPTVREPDGLALSSRNVYLSTEERAQARALFVSLQQARELLSAGERDPARIVREMRALITQRAPLARVDYITVADLDSLRPIDASITSHALISLAAYFDKTRLIDNLIVRFERGAPQFT